MDDEYGGRTPGWQNFADYWRGYQQGLAMLTSLAGNLAASRTYQRNRLLGPLTWETVAEQLPHTTPTYSEASRVNEPQRPVLGMIPTTPAAFSESLAGTRVLNKRGRPRMVFHGTSIPFERFDPAKTDPGALYGAGFYFTENPRIAGGPSSVAPLGYATGDFYKRRYARLGPRPAAALRDDIAMESELHESLPIAVRRTRNYSQMARQLGTTREAEVVYTRGHANVRPAYLGIKRPFDINRGWADADALVRKLGIANRVPRSTSDGALTPYRALQVALGDAESEAASSVVNRILKQEGYDGLTHIGGGAMGELPHRVWIAFDSEQIVPAYAGKK